MGMCYMEIDGSPPELLYENQTDGKGNFVKDIYRNEGSFNHHWVKMADNISRTIREIFIQQPELIPIFQEIYKSQQREVPDSIFDEREVS